MRTEIIGSESCETGAGPVSFSRKIFLAQDSFDPNVDWECSDSLIPEEHDTIRHLRAYAWQIAQLFAEFAVRQRGPRIQVCLSQGNAFRRCQQILGPITEAAFSQLVLTRSRQSVCRRKRKHLVAANFFLFAESLTQRSR